jgi:hypothetical protein
LFQPDTEGCNFVIESLKRLTSDDIQIDVEEKNCLINDLKFGPLFETDILCGLLATNKLLIIYPLLTISLAYFI